MGVAKRQMESFEVKPEDPKPSRFLSAAMSVLNWLAADDLDESQFVPKDDPGDLGTDEIYEFSAGGETYSRTQRVPIPGRKGHYSSYSLTHMKTWVLTQSHNEARRSHYQRCEEAFGIENCKSPLWESVYR